MPNLYRSQQRSRELRGKVRGGITVVLDSPAEAAGLQKLIRSAAGFIAQIEQQPSLANVHLVGWPHDTLAHIKVNAQDLAALMEGPLGASGLPVVFVCHSRGGLVARAAAVKLLKSNPRWVDRLKGAVTFGTPHEGAELAELGDELLGKVLLLKSISQTGRVVPLVDALWAVRGGGGRPLFVNRQLDAAGVSVSSREIVRQPRRRNRLKQTLKIPITCRPRSLPRLWTSCRRPPDPRRALCEPVRGGAIVGHGAAAFCGCVAE
jgi:pimeloyl-ACP methyl ester carboxylesterase